MLSATRAPLTLHLQFADPGGWAQGISFPANQFLKSYPCPAAVNRTCGMEGQILDFITNGADPAYVVLVFLLVSLSALLILLGCCFLVRLRYRYQLQPGISIGGCVPNGTMTGAGWTQSVLRQFLDFLDAHGIKNVTLWVGDAFQIPDKAFTCPWFVPELKAWVKRG